MDFNVPFSSVGKESACNSGDPSSIPGPGRSTGERIGYPLQCFGLENSTDCVVHGVAKSWTRLRLSLHFWSLKVMFKKHLVVLGLELMICLCSPLCSDRSYWPFYVKSSGSLLKAFSFPAGSRAEGCPAVPFSCPQPHSALLSDPQNPYSLMHSK